MDRGAWRATVYGVAKSLTLLNRLNIAYTHTDTNMIYWPEVAKELTKI